jgi:hypothetical protein
MVAHEDERTRALDEILRMSSVPIETRLPGGGHAALTGSGAAAGSGRRAGPRR